MRMRKTAHVQPTFPVGHVVVVAGAAEELVELARRLVDAGSIVALVHPTSRCDTAAASVRADPTDVAVWDRVLPHVEQRLGPIDAVVTDEAAAATVGAVAVPELRRRGRGDAVVLGPGETAGELLNRLRDRPPATPAPPGPAGPG